MASRRGRSLVALIGLVLALPAPVLADAPDGKGKDSTKPAAPGPKGRPVNFGREVRAVLSDNCFACHGPDDKTRKAELRLDTKEGVRAKLKSGEALITPGNPDESELIFRLETDDPELKMPPPKYGKKLTPQQVEALRRWVEQGAPWTTHWAFEVPRKADLPPVKDAKWERNPIDRFILARLEAEGLGPSPEADPTTLVRRVFLDLTGLPPTPREVDAFLADPSDRGYEKLIDRLLDSPRYGEHMARFWLDAARYGDTHGLHLDNYREIWPYRDWVIRAFNGNKPFDVFVLEQLAGDLLPNPTLDQIIATGYNRCHVSTAEGGSIEEEVYVRNVVDQIDTNGTVFLGMTLGCARCHDHKYDPVRMKDYYQLFAFFNNIDGPPMDGNSAKWAPIAKVPSPEQARALDAADRKVAEVRKAIGEEVAKAVAAYDPKADAGASEYVQRGDFVWVDDAAPSGATPAGDGPWEFVAAPEHPVRSGKASLRVTAQGLKQRLFENAGKKLKIGEGDTLFAYVFIDPLNPPKEIMLQWHIGKAWSHRAYWGENVIDWGKDGTPERLRIGDLPPSAKWVRLEVEAKKLGLKPGAVIDGWAFTQHDGTVYWDRAGIETWTPQEGQLFDSLAAWLRARKADKGQGLPDGIRKALEVDRSKRTEAQNRELLGYFLEHGSSGTRSLFEPLHARLARAEAERKAVDDAIPTTLVYRERTGEAKPSFILNRGEYDQRRDKVGRAVPAFLPPLPQGASLDRLGFARWLVAANHPLTARVAVNRFWIQVFGTGIVKTAEDFGSQGEPPSHPELLDWLSVTFREDGWDVKRFMKRLLMSATYRQGAQVTPQGLARDPANRLLWHGPRFRLDAETVRDQALYLSGLLVERVGGPSVKPPQPSGLWEAVGYTDSNTARFTADTGIEKVHRRSLYTFWKRTSPPPQMTTLDAPSREACLVRRERTNTPLQALLMMNEPQFVEASRTLAQRVLREAGPTTDDRLTTMFRMATSRRPDAKDLAELNSALNDFLAHYAKDAAAAGELIGIGETKPDPRFTAGELAAWTMIGNVILNLDEVMTKN
ncbi:MAG: PSD1 and planctomycete cytochrome C domain-containing protein [Isosphaeraceae bacterium]